MLSPNEEIRKNFNLQKYKMMTVLVCLQPSEEEEIVDLMLMKLCSLFGLKSKKKDDALTEEAPISSALETKQLTISTTDVHDGWSVSLVK